MDNEKETRMVRTFKIDLFTPLRIEITEENLFTDQVPLLNGRQFKSRKVITVTKFREESGHIIIDEKYCDLRPITERYDEHRKNYIPSSIENIFTSESVLTHKYSKSIGEEKTLYDFIGVDFSAGNDNDELIRRVKDALCFDGIYLSLAALEHFGYTLHDEAETLQLENITYIKYRLVAQSASENRQCKATFSTYKWNAFANNITAGAKYLKEPTQSSQKALSRLGLCKTGGTIIKDFKFSFIVVPDLYSDISFKARCFYDAENKIIEENISIQKNVNDGHG